jgi:8-oxo-dGTP diphosphatase
MASVVFILVNGWQVLMEHRPDDPNFGSEEWLFPGGKLHDGEPPEDALCREMREELGVAPCVYYPLAGENDPPIYYHKHAALPEHRMYPFLVNVWSGALPNAILDTGRAVAWRPIHAASRSPIKCTRQMADLVVRML